MSILNNIESEIAALPPALRAEVLDFVQFVKQRHGLASLDAQILADAATSLASGTPFTGRYAIRNHHLTVGARVAGALAKRSSGAATLEEASLTLHFTGSAGQSFGAVGVQGMHLTLEGEANDYVGKGLNGADISIRPFHDARYLGAGHLNMIIGNTVLYGATGGTLFAAGQAGDRFAVRNSGACAVVEGVGNHACEYMTGGVVAVLGRAGRNFGAGMSNGIAYVFDENNTFASRVNHDMVLLAEFDTDDDALLLLLLRSHIARTASARGRQLLDEWETTRNRWRKVKPRGAAEPVARIRDEWTERLAGQLDTPPNLPRVDVYSGAPK